MFETLKTFRTRLRNGLAETILGAAILLAGVTAAVVPVPADAALTISAASRTSMANALLTDINGGTIELWNGTKPAALGTPTGTLLATLTMGNPAGTVSNGVLTIGSVTQTSSAHVNGTPTFVRFKSSGGLVRMDIDIGAGAGNVQFTGTVATNQNVTVTGLTLTIPNA